MSFIEIYSLAFRLGASRPNEAPHFKDFVSLVTVVGQDFQSAVNATDRVRLVCKVEGLRQRLIEAPEMM